MAKNVSKLYYPIQESIRSILPIVDEFVVALGDCDADDNTREMIHAINSPKIRIIDTVWDIQKYPRGMENAHQTDIAKNACSGDWLFYLQADEVVHEKYLDSIVKDCEYYADAKEVEGFLFNYMHFFGDYRHYNDHHGWYPKEIRIVRNDPDIHSYISAQSFRRIPDFDGKSYRQKEGTYKLHVIESPAYIYHYGWVRPPRYMQKKARSLDTIHHGKKQTDVAYKDKDLVFDYGNMNRYRKFKGGHPAVMQEKINDFNWQKQLHFEPAYKPERKKMKHEKPKYRFLTWMERHLLKNTNLFRYSNWKIIPRSD